MAPGWLLRRPFQIAKEQCLGPLKCDCLLPLSIAAGAQKAASTTSLSLHTPSTLQYVRRTQTVRRYTKNVPRTQSGGLGKNVATLRESSLIERTTQ